MELFWALLTGYVIGSINFAVPIARSKGVDLFAIGSGNPGATNVKRTMGAFWGNTVFVLDFLKGVVTVWVCFMLFDSLEFTKYFVGIIGLSGAIIGHSFSLFLKFKGGKGVATTMGGLLVLMCPVLVIGLVVWVLFFYATKIVAVASIVFAVSLPISALFFYSDSDSRFIFSLVLSGLIILRHHANIKRLIFGEENSFKS